MSSHSTKNKWQWIRLVQRFTDRFIYGSDLVQQRNRCLQASWWYPITTRTGRPKFAHPSTQKLDPHSLNPCGLQNPSCLLVTIVDWLQFQMHALTWGWVLCSYLNLANNLLAFWLFALAKTTAVNYLVIWGKNGPLSCCKKGYSERSPIWQDGANYCAGLTDVSSKLPPKTLRGQGWSTSVADQIV